MNYKKGQVVTFFILLGLFLLAVVAFLIYSRSNVADTNQEEQMAKIKEVDSNLKPIQTYVQQCMFDVGYKGLKLIAENGGYLDPMNTQIFNYNPVDVVDNDGVYLMDGYFVPYWSYSSDAINVLYFTQKTRIPLITDIEILAKKYIEENLLDCLGDLSGLQYSTDLVIEEDPNIQVLITEDNVKIRNDMSIFIEEENRRVNEYYVELNLPFKKYYDVAYLVASEHQQNQYIEKLMLNLISFYSGVNSNKLPPMYANFRGYESVMWNQIDVGNKLRQMMQSYIQLLRVLGSKNSLQFNLEGLSKIEEQLFLASQLAFVNPDYISNAEITFIYNNFPTYSKVSCRRCSDSLIQPSKTEIGSPIGSKDLEWEYDFYYDIVMPVVAEIKFDSIGGNTEPFIFLIGLESNIRKNLMWTDYATGEGYLPWSEDMITESFKIVYNDSVSEEFIEYNETPQSMERLFADENQKISGDITVRVYDANTLNEIEGAIVTVGIQEYSSSTLGATMLQEDNEIKFVGKSPIMYNGFISVEKKDYAKHYQLITTNIDEEQEIIVRLEPEVYKNFSIKVFDMNTGVLRNLTSNESVTIFLEKINRGDSVVKYQEIIQITNSTTEGKLIAGEMKLNGMFLDATGFIIPKECKRYCKDTTLGFCTGGWEKVPKDDIEVKPSMWGGVEFDENNSIIIPTEKLYEDNIIEFRILKLPTPRCIDDLEIINKIKEITLFNQNVLMPVYLKNDGSIN